MKMRIFVVAITLSLLLSGGGLSVAVRGEARDGNVEASRKTVLEEEISDDGEWHYLYEADERRPDIEIGLGNLDIWYGAIRLELPAGEITEIAYFDGQAADYIKGQIYTDGGDEPGELIGETEKYYDTGSVAWDEIPLIESVPIDRDYYWVVLEIDDPAGDVYPFGVIEPYVEDGGWISIEEGNWETLPDHEDFNYSWGLEVFVSEADPAEFILEDWAIEPSPVDAGGTFRVEGDVENIGDIAGNETVYLYIDDELEATKEVAELEGDDRETVTFEHSEKEVGTYEVRVETEDDYWTGEVEVEPADPALVEIDPEEDQDITAGETIEFSVEVYDEYDNLITAEASDLEWDNADDGVFDESDAGGYNVTATYGDVTSQPTTVRVEPAEVDYILITPDDYQVTTARESIDFLAQAHDEYDNLITDSREYPFDFMWENAEAAPGGAKFDESKAGEYDVTATYDGVTSQPTTVRVEPAEVDYVEISVEDSTIKAGETTDFTAEAYDEHDNLITEEAEDFDWENADDGVFDGTEAEDHDVTAIYGDVDSDSVTVAVEPAEVDEVEIDPDEHQVISAGETIEFTAGAYDEYDNLITDEVEDFDWDNADSGMFEETEAGGYEVQTLYEGEGSDEVIVTVEPGEADYIEITPDKEDTVDSGETIEFEAEAYDEYGNLITDDPADFDWENADDGVFDKTEGGDFDVNAEYDGVTSDPVTVTVEAGIPGFTLALLLLASVIAVAIYYKRKQPSHQDEDYSSMSAR